MAGDFDLMSEEARTARLIALRRAFAGNHKGAQAEFAEQMGLQQSTWNNYERGHRIGISQALVICARTGVSLDWIYRGIAREDLMPRRLITELNETMRLMKAEQRKR